MRKMYLFKTFLLLCALIVGAGSSWAQAPVNTVMWAEDFSGYSANDVPSGSITDSHSGTTVYGGVTLTYSCSNGASTTQVYTTGGPNGNNNILVSKNYGTFVVSGISTGNATELTLSYSTSGSGSLSVTTSTTGASISGSTINTGGAETISLTFTNTNKSNNLRLDDISLKVLTAGTGGSSVGIPVFSIASGTAVAYGTTVTLTQEDADMIMYTIDGSDPSYESSNGEMYSAPIAITSDMTIKAIAIDESENESAVATASYTIIRPNEPTFSETAGAVESGTEVTVTAPEGCTLYYTTDGSDPVSSGMSAGGRTKAFTITEAQTIKAVSKDAHGFFSSVVTVAYTIAVLNEPTFSVADMTLVTGEQKAPEVTTNSEGTVSYVSGDPSIATVVDGEIYGVAKGVVTITANITKDTENLLKAASTTFEVTVTPTPVWESTSEGIDVLTYSTCFSESGNGYADFSGKSVSSSAVYAGKANKTNDMEYIQIKNNSPIGIVTTSSGGYARKIVVTWDKSTKEGRYIEVYGKSSAYESGADLYDKDKKGTLLGSIKKGTSTELTIEGDYEYIGILASDPLYMNNLTVYWEGESISLSDASDYTPVAADYAKVTVNRSFVEGWNGIVLPFNLTESVKTALGATAVKTLASATETAGAITLGFEDASLPVAAGTPVLVKLATAKESGDVIMNGVKLETTTPATITKTISETNFSLTGTYSSTTLTDAEAYFVSNGTFYHKAEGTALTAKPFRAYILQTGNAAARVLFDLEGETTGIKELDSLTNSQMDNCYDLSGRKIVNGQSVNGKLQRGLYILNGKKYIVK